MSRDENPVFTRTQYGQNGPIVEYVIHGGGHAWYGRRMGVGMESPFSKMNLGSNPLPTFSVNEAIVREYGLDCLS